MKSLVKSIFPQRPIQIHKHLNFSISRQQKARVAKLIDLALKLKMENFKTIKNYMIIGEAPKTLRTMEKLHKMKILSWQKVR